ncbi:MAG TPA: phage tail protein [Candidatus Binataceae bacterium]|nr:phage tail protein [Candidatus Binataceae bacterium]
MFALFGEIPFQVIGSPEILESSRRFDYAEHRVVEDRPRLQWLAAELESITLAMLFHASFTDPALQLEALLAAGYDHQARALVLGNGTFRGFFVVESVVTSAIQLGADATPIAIRVQAKLREWAPGSEFDPAAPPLLAAVPLAIAAVSISYSSPAALLGKSGASAASYSAPTFSQPGVSALVDNPLPGGQNGPNLSYTDVLAAAIVRSPQ